MLRLRTDQEITPGLVIDKPRQSYRVERVLMNEPTWALCEMSKTRGTYAGNLVTAEIIKDAS